MRETSSKVHKPANVLCCVSWDFMCNCICAHEKVLGESTVSCRDHENGANPSATRKSLRLQAHAHVMALKQSSLRAQVDLTKSHQDEALFGSFVERRVRWRR